jgi:hypothetical protein
MALDKATREAALKALDAIKQYSREGFTYGVDRVGLYYDDVEGDWLDEFVSDEQQPQVEEFSCDEEQLIHGNQYLEVGKIQVNLPFPWQLHKFSKYQSIAQKTHEPTQYRRFVPLAESTKGIVYKAL